jgi:putative FmdB family regulatory protein
MPTYQYRCLECDYRFEEFQNITEPPIENCPECGGRAERLISGGAGFLFKGSGFYITDYRSDGYKKSAEMDKASPTPSSSANSKSEKLKSSSDTSVKKTA